MARAAPPAAVFKNLRREIKPCIAKPPKKRNGLI
jgi:hypothetical protein